jgi:hypothetical protein
MITDHYPFPPEGPDAPRVKEDAMLTMKDAEAPFAQLVRRRLRHDTYPVVDFAHGRGLILAALDEYVREACATPPRERSPGDILAALARVGAAAQAVAEGTGLAPPVPLA